MQSVPGSLDASALLATLRYPFEERHPAPNWLVRPHIDKLLSIREEVVRRITPLDEIDDARRGFGSVYAFGRLHRPRLTLGIWRWRQPEPTKYPLWLAAKYFVDEPLGAMPGATLAARCRVADVFAAVANERFDPEDVRFAVRPLEVVAATEERPAGVYRSDDADTLAVDFFVGVPMSRIIDALVEIEFRSARALSIDPMAEDMQIAVWHRAKRIIAARAMFGLDLPPIRVPAVAAFKRRVEQLEDTAYRNTQNM